MKTAVRWGVFLLMAAGLVLPSGKATGSEEDVEDIRQLLQMPVATSRLAAAGVPDRTLNQITSGLNRGEFTPAQFNAFLRQTPAIAEGFESIDRVGAFVTSQVRAGRRGEELANIITAELRRLGIPAGELTSPGPPPLAREEFLPVQSQTRIRRAIEAQQQDIPDEPADGPGAQPGQPTQPGPGPQPGMPGPEGGPMP